MNQSLKLGLLRMGPPVFKPISARIGQEQEEISFWMIFSFLSRKGSYELDSIYLLYQPTTVKKKEWPINELKA